MPNAECGIRNAELMKIFPILHLKPKYESIQIICKNNDIYIKQLTNMDFKNSYKAVVRYPLCESSGYVKQAKAGKPPQIKSVSLFLRRFQEYHSP